MGATAKKNLLPELINSLTANEKRYFALFTSITPGDKNFTKLFKALEGEAVYDSQKIKGKLSPTKMNVAYEKAYLQKALLKSLRNFNDDATEEIRLHNTLIDIEVLFRKQRYGFCLELIKKALTVAEKQELLALALQFMRWEKRCRIRMGAYDEMEKHFTQGLQRELKIISSLENLAQYQGLQSLMLSVINRKGSVLRTEERAKLKQIISHPLMKSADRALSFRAKTIYYEIQMFYHHCLLQFSKADEFNRKALKEFELNPVQIDVNPQGYFAMLTNLCNRQLTLEKYDELAKTIERIEAFLEKYNSRFSQSQLTDIRAANLEKKLMLLNYTNNFLQTTELGESIMHEIENAAEVYRPGFYIVFYLHISIAWFYLKNYDTALRHIRKVLDGYDDKVRPDFIFMAHILHYLIHYELKHYDLLPYLATSINRFTKTRGLNIAANKLLVKFLHELAKASLSNETSKEVIQKYRLLLEPFRKDNVQNVVLDTLDLFKWMNAELKG
jgi:hypothetical protein